MSCVHDPAAKGGHTHPKLVLEIVGVTMLLPESKRVVLVNGTPRVSVTNPGSIIPRHYPFIALRPGTYSTDLESRLSFCYDIEGHGDDEEKFDAFALDRVEVSVENVEANEAALLTENIPEMGQFISKSALRPTVIRGSDDAVAARVDLPNAMSIVGHQHHMNGSDKKIRFGKKVMADCADKITATFDAGHMKPRIRLECCDRTHFIDMTGDGPWVVMIGNVPFEELTNVNSFGKGRGIKLTHFELLYDLYEKAGTKQVPTFDNVEHGMTTEGFCGPPVKP